MSTSALRLVADQGIATDSILRESRPFQGLTHKQEQFAQAVAQGTSYVQAYRKAYPCIGWKPESVARKASELAGNVKVLARIRQLSNHQSQVTSLIPVVSREAIINGIMSIAQKQDAKDADRLKAYELIGKIRGIDLFREVSKDAQKPKTAEEIDEQLRALLSPSKTTDQPDSDS